MISTLFTIFGRSAPEELSKVTIRDLTGARAQDTTARSRRERVLIQSFGHVRARFVLDSI